MKLNNMKGAWHSQKPLGRPAYKQWSISSCKFIQLWGWPAERLLTMSGPFHITMYFPKVNFWSSGYKTHLKLFASTMYFPKVNFWSSGYKTQLKLYASALCVDHFEVLKYVGHFDFEFPPRNIWKLSCNLWIHILQTFATLYLDYKALIPVSLQFSIFLIE